jgi:hypothetical protein
MGFASLNPSYKLVASSFETYRFAMLLRMRSLSTLVVRSAATPRVSNHEARAPTGT